MKLIAMYLPQFHRTAENDEWWGDGFTDWDAVRSASSLFDDQRLPRRPLDDNYYDLSTKEPLIWQADLMNRYGIDGMCFYHYYFKDGRKILEKPAENLLKWKDIDMPFCFCWANETWARSWSYLNDKNVWADIFEKDKQKKAKKILSDDGILLKQEYGLEEAWRKHFYYLLPFFNDERYIKEDGKPVFVFYHAEKIPCILPMIECWRELALENGIPGLYIYGGYTEPWKAAKRGIDAVYYHEPVAHKVLLDRRRGEYGHVYGYDEIWDSILNHNSDYKVSYGGFVDYDDTPRRGRNGYRFTGFSPDKFRGYLTGLIKKNRNSGSDIVFINAWNEWGEGMFLEPDEEYKLSTLEAVKAAREEQPANDKQGLEEDETDVSEKRRSADKNIVFSDDDIRDFLSREKDTVYLHSFDKWMACRERGKRVSSWLRCNGFSHVAVYGYGLLGKHLLTELNHDDFKVDYIFDKSTDVEESCGVPVFKPSSTSCEAPEIPDTDLLIVTPFVYFEEIYRDMKRKYGFRIVSLSQILEEIY